MVGPSCDARRACGRRVRRFARPRTGTATFAATLQPNWEIMEYICQEGNNFGVAGGHTNPFVGQ